MSGLERNDTAHVEWDELAVGWTLRALEPDDEHRFSTHLRGCERCHASVQDSGLVLSALVERMPLESPSPALRSRLLAEINKTPRDLEAFPLPPEPASSGGQLVDFAAAGQRSMQRRSRSELAARSRWSKIAALAAAAAGVLLIAGLGIWNVTLQADRDTATSVAADRGEILQNLAAAGEVTMTPLHDGDGQSVATLVVGSSQAMVMTNGLPVNDNDDEIYVLWGLQEVGEQPQALGTFDVVDAELDMRTVGSTVAGLDAFNGYAVTLESGRQAPDTPTLPMVATG
ncbi:MAG: anti-sigma factor [Actinomycetota bacterium]|nr:anti-sigma factor [Actinomycetota bacterium]